MNTSALERVRSKVGASERAPVGETALWRAGALSAGAGADGSAIFQDIEVLKNTNVDGEISHLPPDASDIERKFAKVKSKFIGKPRLGFEFAKLIILIRRGIALETNLSLFFRLADAEIEFFLRTLSTRWLISVADTYADHGTPLQQATATMIVSLFNMVKLTETERLIVGNSEHDPNKVDWIARRRERNETLKLWDEMPIYDIYCGDMPKNMIRRMRRIAFGEQVLSKILDTLLARALSGPTILSRLAHYNSAFLPEDWRTQQ